MNYVGDSDLTEKPVEPIKVYSEKELIREFEKISLTLVPEKDWSVRIGAMQRVEALVIGGLFYMLYLNEKVEFKLLFDTQHKIIFLELLLVT